MIWHKAWLDTRWRFLIGLAVLIVSACTTVFEFVQIGKLVLTIGEGADGGGQIAAAIDQAIEAQRTYRGFVWFNWFRQASIFILLAALLGSGNPLSRSGRGLLFTLALPVARSRWIEARAVLGLGELLALAIVPSLVFPVLSPLIGEQYGLGEALAHSTCMFVGGSVFFSLALFLSTVFDDLWRPLLLTCLAAVALALAELAAPSFDAVFAVVSAESYFRGGSLPWAGLAISVVVGAALTYAAAVNVTRRDY